MLEKMCGIDMAIYYDIFRCYPINTALADPYELDQKLRDYYIKISRSQYMSDEEISSEDDTSSESESDSSDSSNVRITIMIHELDSIDRN